MSCFLYSSSSSSSTTSHIPCLLSCLFCSLFSFAVSIFLFCLCFLSFFPVMSFLYILLLLFPHFPHSFSSFLFTLFSTSFCCLHFSFCIPVLRSPCCVFPRLLSFIFIHFPSSNSSSMCMLFPFFTSRLMTVFICVFPFLIPTLPFKPCPSSICPSVSFQLSLACISLSIFLFFILHFLRISSSMYGR